MFCFGFRRVWAAVCGTFRFERKVVTRAVGPPRFVFTSDVMLQRKVSMLQDACVVELVSRSVLLRVGVGFSFLGLGLFLLDDGVFDGARMVDGAERC